MTTQQNPSDYELEAWERLRKFEGRPIARLGHELGQKMVEGAVSAGRRVDGFLEKRPGAQAVVAKGKGAATAAGHALRGAGGKVAQAVPDAVADWASEVAASAQKLGARVARAGLTPAVVIKKHRKHGHEVARLSDLRRLDLEEVDAVRGRAASWAYPALAALSGAGAGLAVVGGQFVVVAGAGAAAAPAGAVVVGAVAGDAAIVLALASRAIGDIALHYGYDPEDPEEKLFILSAINLGTAASTSAKMAALADISRLTQLLVRGKTWEVLNRHLLTRVARELATKFGFRLTQKGLGKLVPVVGVAAGGVTNWASLEGIFDAAEMSYRRRFLLEKYPHFAGDDTIELVADREADGVRDEAISVIDEFERAAGDDEPEPPQTDQRDD
jgi:hypothetical protein